MANLIFKKNSISLAFFNLLIICIIFPVVSATGYRPIVIHPNSVHDKWVTKSANIVKHFRAYTTSFDSEDGDVFLEISKWVAYEI